MPTEKLSEFEYSFSDVPADELPACCFYEYARESKSVIHEVDGERIAQRTSGGKTRTIKFGPKVTNSVQSHLLITLAWMEGFPKKPWMALSSKDKTSLQKQLFTVPYLALYSATATNPPLAFALKESGSTTLDMWIQRLKQSLAPIPDNDHVKYGFFRINMKYGHALLVQEFARHLRSFEGKPILEYPPTPQLKTKRPPGRKSIHDTLNALGVLRLRYHCKTFIEAQNKMKPLKDKPYGMYYGRSVTANRACKLALIYFKKSLGWIDSENPVHYISRWRGGHQNRN